MGFDDEGNGSFFGVFGSGTPGRLFPELSTPDWAAFTTLTPSCSGGKSQAKVGQQKEFNPFEMSFSTGNSASIAEEDEPTPALEDDTESFRRSLKRSSSPNNEDSDTSKRPRLSIVQSSLTNTDSPASSAVRTPSGSGFPMPVVHEAPNDLFEFSAHSPGTIPLHLDPPSALPRYTGHKPENVYTNPLPSPTGSLSSLLNFNGYVPSHVQPAPQPLPALPAPRNVSIQQPVPIIEPTLQPAIATPLLAASQSKRRSGNASDTTVVPETVKPRTRAKPGPKKGSTRKPKAKAQTAAAVEQPIDLAEGEGEGDDEEKRKQFLERNRLAACKSRQKKKEWIGGLEQQASELAAQNADLQATVDSLRDEVVQLRMALSKHQNCTCSAAQSSVQHSSTSQSQAVDNTIATASTATSLPTSNLSQSYPARRNTQSPQMAIADLPAFHLSISSQLPAHAQDTVFDVPPRPASAPANTPGYMDHKLNDYFSQPANSNAGVQNLNTPDLVAQLGF